MIEMMVGEYAKPTPGLKGTVYGRTRGTISGYVMKMSSSGKFLGGGYMTANDGAGAVFIVDLSNLSNPVIKRNIRLPEWRTGATAGTYTRAGQSVRGTADLRRIVTNSESGGFDMGALYVIELDADHNVTDSVRLIPAGTVGGDYLGTYLDMSEDGTVIAVSAVGYSSFTGRVYIYARKNGTWALEAIIPRPAGELGQRFGTTISISGDGEWMTTACLGSATPGISRVYLFKRNGGTWNLVTTVADSRGLTGSGRQTGHLSTDGKKLFVAYCYHNSAPGTPEGGYDIYDINQTTGALSGKQTVPNGVPGGGYSVISYVNYDGSAIMGSPSLPAGNQYRGVNCVQLNKDTGQYENSWSFTTPDLAAYQVYPAINDAATVWAAACPSLLLQQKDSFFCGR